MSKDYLNQISKFNYNLHLLLYHSYRQIYPIAFFFTVSLSRSREYLENIFL